MTNLFEAMAAHWAWATVYTIVVFVGRRGALAVRRERGQRRGQCPPRRC